MTPTGTPLQRFAVPLVLLIGAASGPALFAQAVSPPPPKSYQAVVRYRLSGARDLERLGQYRDLLRRLAATGFERIDDDEDDTPDLRATRVRGTVASGNARKLLLGPGVQTLLLAPDGFDLARPGANVKVRLELASGLLLERQRLLVDQLRDLLADLGFREAIGYDPRGHTVLKGTVPGNNLLLLLEDLRVQGTGWFLPGTPVRELPLPIRDQWPVRVVEITPEPAGVAPLREAPRAVAAPAGQEHLLKITPELRALIGQEGAAETPLRLDVILAATPLETEMAWRQSLLAVAPGLRVEGRLGPVVTVLARGGNVADLAALPGVSTVRMPRAALVSVRPDPDSKVSADQILYDSGLARLHGLGQRGRGVRLAVVGTDFRGYQALVGKRLPAATRLVDFTTERNGDVRPDPFLGDSKELGHGTLCALAAALAAPEAELTLVRLDPTTPYQLLTLARYVNGEAVASDPLRARDAELAEEEDNLRRNRSRLRDEGKKILDDFGTDDATLKRRAEYQKRVVEQDQAEAENYRRQVRYQQLLADYRALKGIRVIGCPLVWTEGYPVDGTNALTRYLDETRSFTATWIQATGDAAGTAWAGLYHDADGNGVMEFAPPGVAPRPSKWTSELNFLAWQPHAGEASAELPARARTRISFQWSEVHDPSLAGAEDLYRKPLAPLTLVLLRQRDPTGKQLATDDLEVVARSEALPQRLDNQPGRAVYEHTLDFTAEAAGRYALRVEGVIPPGTRPPEVPTLPGQLVTWELRPRIALHTFAPAAAHGRVVFLDYPTKLGTLGMPADSTRALAVAAAAPAGGAQPYSAAGRIVGKQLLPKPDLLTADVFPAPAGARRGTGLAAAYAAGFTATALGAANAPGQLLPALRLPPGSVLKLD